MEKQVQKNVWVAENIPATRAHYISFDSMIHNYFVFFVGVRKVKIYSANLDKLKGVRSQDLRLQILTSSAQNSHPTE